MNFITYTKLKTCLLSSVLLLSTVLFSGTSFGQNQRCGFDEIHNHLLQTDGDYAVKNKELEKNYQKFLNKPDAVKSGVVTVPVVFHVIHLGEAEGQGSNIHDEQAQAMIDGMNYWFRNQYPDGSKVHPDGIDTEIEFCLAKTDPSGQPTTGVLRVDGRSVPNYESMGCVNDGSANDNEQQVKALSKWDKNDYYNVWIVHRINDQNFATQGGTAGYAYFPGANAAVDGTIIHVLTAGYVIPPGSPPAHWAPLTSWDNGTLNHELGHAFSLYHTFNGGGNSPGSGCPPYPESNCNTGGDRVCDTEPHTGDLGTCRQAGSYVNPCSGNPYDVYISDNIMNYTNCSPLLFSPGQKDRLRAVLEPGGGRYSLTLNSNACFSPLDWDLSVTEVTQPDQFYCDSTVTGTFKVKNLGKNEVTSFNYIIGVDGVDIDTIAWTGTLAVQGVVEITTPQFTTTVGIHNFNVRTDSVTINGSNTDERTENDTKTKAFEIINGDIVKVEVTNHKAGDRFIIRDDGGTELYNIGLDGGATYFSEFCLRADACYSFELIDTECIPPGWIYNGEPGGLPSYTVYNVDDYEIISGFDNPPNSPTFPYSETESFCLPFEVFGVTANFTASQTIVLVGEDIQFTDQSIVDPSVPVNSWDWDFGDGQTDNIQNPIHTYWTPGLYTVTLTADNVNNIPSTATKKQYIRVIDNTADCITLNNLVSPETAQASAYDASIGGYMTGPNTSKAPTMYAERFLSPGGAGKVTSIEIYFDNKSTVVTPASEIQMSLRKEIGGVPSDIISSVNMQYGDLTLGGYTTFELATPVTVNGFFYVTLNMPSGATGDTLVIGAAASRGAGFYSNTAYVNSNNVWGTLPSIYGSEHVTSLAVRVNTSPISEAIIQPLSYKTCLNKPVQVSGSSSVDATNYRWSFPGGSPPTSNQVEPFVTYNTEGTHYITLYTKAATCAVEDSTIAIVKVSGTVDDTVLTIQETCGAADGYAELKVNGGSGVYTYEWFDGTTGVTKMYNMSAGNYTVKWTDQECGSTNTLNFEIPEDTLLAAFTVDVEHTSCGEQNGKATINAFGNGLSYNWELIGDPNFSNTGKIGAGLEPGTYSVFTQRGTCKSLPQEFTIDPSTNVNAVVDSVPASICATDTAVLSASGTNGATEIRWLDVYGDTIAWTPSVAVAPMNMTLYTAVAIRNDGCWGDSTVTLNVIEAPVFYMWMDDDADGNYQRDSVTVGLNNNGTVYFSSVGSQSNSFLWEFGDGETSSFRDPQHSYADTGTYTVTLTLGSGTCTYSESRTVFVVDSAWSDTTKKDTVPIDTGGTGGTTSITTYQNVDNIFTAYPNPVSSKLMLKALNNEDLSTLEVFSAVGKKINVKVEKESNDLYSISVEELAAGNYLLRAILPDRIQQANIVVIK